MRIIAHGVNYIGKESDQLEEVEAGIHHDPNEILSQYADSQHDDWADIIRPALVLAVESGLTTDAEIARSEVHVDRSTVGRWRKGEAKPHPFQREKLQGFLAELVVGNWKQMRCQEIS